MIREWNKKDSEALSKQANDQSIWNQMRDEFPYPYTDECAKQFIENLSKDPNAIDRAIINEDTIAGSISIKINDDIRRFSGVLSYWLGVDYRGKGLATAAVIEIVELAFSEFDLMRIYAKVFDNNKASIAVLEKAGFKKEGHFRKAIFKSGVFHDQLLYAKIKS